MRICLLLVVLVALPLSSSAQHPKQFVQAELLKTIKARSAKIGDIVKARANNALILSGKVTISEGTILLGEIRAVEPSSLSISFDQMEVKGKPAPLSLSIRAALSTAGDASAPHAGQAVAAQAGAVIGMPGVTLQVDDSPRHASTFQSNGKDLQLKQGLLLMLAPPD